MSDNERPLTLTTEQEADLRLLLNWAVMKGSIPLALSLHDLLAVMIDRRNA